MIPIAAEGVTVLQIEMSCARMGDKGMYSTVDGVWQRKVKVDINSHINVGI